MTATVNPRVLYAEDNEDACEMVTYMLKLKGIDVTLAKNAADAMHLAKAGIFDLYLLDSRLPDESGLELCSRLRLRAPHTPIVFYSALAYAVDIQNGMSAGANDYLVKPYGGDLAQTILTSIENPDVYTAQPVY
jgi:two-component system phosphate regulon response regulator PhoB